MLMGMLAGITLPHMYWRAEAMSCYTLLLRTLQDA